MPLYLSSREDQYRSAMVLGSSDHEMNGTNVKRVEDLADMAGGNF